MKIFYVAGGIFPAVLLFKKRQGCGALACHLCITDRKGERETEGERKGKKKGEGPAGQLIRRR